MASRAQMTAAILETCAEGAGGALAGYLDTKFADKKVGGMGLGMVVAFAGVGLGMAGVGGAKMSHYLREMGGGAGAFEVGKMVAERTQRQMAQSAPLALRAIPGGRVSGVVGALPPSRQVVTPQALQESLAMLRNMG